MALTESDIARAAILMDLSEAEFLSRWCIRRGEEWHLIDQQDEEQSCIFLTVDEQGLHGCRIHAAKPGQCAGFPFQWRPRNAVEYCEGLRALEGLPRGASRRKI